MSNAMKLTKTCLVCGTAKQLSAFLQLTSQDSTLYGNVCSSCRGSEAKLNEQVIVTDDARGSTSAGLRLGADAKHQAELEDKKRREDKEQLRREENEKREKRLNEKFERTDLIEKNEKKHRKNFISLLNAKTPATTEDKKKPTSQHTFLNENTQHAQATLTEKQSAQLKQAREEVAKEEDRITNVDLSSPTLGLRGEETRYHSATFQTFKNWLGGSAPIANAANKAQAKKTQEKSKENALKEEPIEYANKAWTSGRKR